MAESSALGIQNNNITAYKDKAPDQVGQVLENVPQTCELICDGLQVFGESMKTCFATVTPQMAEMLPQFTKLRNATMTDTITYFEYVVPCCKKVVQDACQFFKHFNDDYDTVELFMEEIDLLLEDTNKFAVAFSLCADAHGPVLKQAEFRSLQCAKLVTIAAQKTEELENIVRETEEAAKQAEEDAQTLKEDGEKSLWNHVPVAQTFHQANVRQDVRNKQKEARQKEQAARAQNQTIIKLNEIIRTIQNDMIVALERYINSIMLMQAIFTELHADTDDVAKRIEKLKENSDTKRRADVFYRRIKNVSTKLAGNLQSVVHIFNAIECKFKAMKDFAQVDAKYTAQILQEIQALMNSPETFKKLEGASDTSKKQACKYMKDISEIKIDLAILNEEKSLSDTIAQVPQAEVDAKLKRTMRNLSDNKNLMMQAIRR